MVELYHKVRRCIGASFKGRRILMISKTVKENLIIFAGIALLCSDLIGSISLYLTSIVFCTDYMVIISYENLVGWKIINTLLLYILVLVINDMTNSDPLLKTVKMNRLPVYHIFLGILAGPFLLWIATVLQYYLLTLKNLAQFLSQKPHKEYHNPTLFWGDHSIEPVLSVSDNMSLC